MWCREIGLDNSKLQQFVDEALEIRSRLPREVLSGKDEVMAARTRMRNLTAADFLREFPDPEVHFNDLSRATTERYRKNVVQYMKQQFPHLSIAKFNEISDRTNCLLVPMLKEVNDLPNKGKGKGKKSSTIGDSSSEDDVTVLEPDDLDFLKEMSYLRLADEIKQMINDRRDTVARAVADGEVFECDICYEEDCLKAEMIVCERGCQFCPGCVKRGAEIQLGQNTDSIRCIKLAACGAEISLHHLNNVLSSSQMKSLESIKQQKEVEAAGIENLVHCPGCNYGVIIDPDNTEKIIVCKNPECGRETCRSCGEENHIPQSCEEAETESEVRARTRVEDAMTDALVRECPRCKRKFVKEGGCNSMRCECGQSMCYLCKQPLAATHDPHHFGPGKCQLFEDETPVVENEVHQAAERAKRTINIDHLRIDPSENIGNQQRRNRSVEFVLREADQLRIEREDMEFNMILRRREADHQLRMAREVMEFNEFQREMDRVIQQSMETERVVRVREEQRRIGDENRRLNGEMVQPGGEGSSRGRTRGSEKRKYSSPSRTRYNTSPSPQRSRHHHPPAPRMREASPPARRVWIASPVSASRIRSPSPQRSRNNDDHPPAPRMREVSPPARRVWIASPAPRTREASPLRRSRVTSPASTSRIRTLSPTSYRFPSPRLSSSPPRYRPARRYPSPSGNRYRNMSPPPRVRHERVVSIRQDHGTNTDQDTHHYHHHHQRNSARNRSRSPRESSSKTERR